jgi:hypothetical protein
MKGRGHSEDLDVDGRINVRLDLRETGKMWTGIIWLRTGTSNGLL